MGEEGTQLVNLLKNRRQWLSAWKEWNLFLWRGSREVWKFWSCVTPGRVSSWAMNWSCVSAAVCYLMVSGTKRAKPVMGSPGEGESPSRGGDPSAGQAFEGCRRWCWSSQNWPRIIPWLSSSTWKRRNSLRRAQLDKPPPFAMLIF